MEKKIEDYLHFYVGCKCYTNRSEAFGDAEVLDGALLDLAKAGLQRVKPILRPFSSATDSEILELNKQTHQFDTGNPASHITTDWAYKIDWLIKKRFDVFGLIPAGLAIDSTLTPISSTTNI